jgi:hypothetical protein
MTQIKLFSINSNPFGISFSDWCVRWIKWCLETPANINPAKDPTGKFGYTNQPTDAPVWFLAGNYMRNTQRVVRKCVIPAGKYLLFPVMEKECSFSEEVDLHTEEELVERTKLQTSRVIHLECRIDDIYVENLYDYKLQLPVFDLNFPDNNVYGALSFITRNESHTTRSTSNGFWIFFREPLKEQGDKEHEIYFKAIHERPFFYVEMTYKILVVDETQQPTTNFIMHPDPIIGQHNK